MDNPSFIQRLESVLLSIGIGFFQTLFFFLTPPQQSLMVSLFHYAIFMAGLYYFIYYASPNGTYRVAFFLFVFASLVSYVVFNKCLLTHMEHGISKQTNAIQRTMETFFGSSMEGNWSSKIVLSLLTFLTGGILIHDYGVGYASTG